ncbi:MAG: histidine phosphatase family protein [Oscillospiraceae bacterium]|nr:histidine phosphatase family protein [Oscillospiraceae bacterium]
MSIWLLRHGRTQFNDERRYQGMLDIPLSPVGAAELRAAEFAPETVYVSPLRRSQETARIVFPDARQIVVDDFAEMDFGAFDGRTADEMAEDAAYRAWVDGDCTARCPGGESRAAFCDRSCAAFERLLDDGKTCQGKLLVIVAHGGTLRAVMERFALPERDYFDWMSGNGGGYRLSFDAALWDARRKLRLVERVSFVREAAQC